jgi:23S rRNA (uracil1939-C5)-methyltransferase
MLTPGQQLELQVEKPAAGGRMIARHEGQVLFVLGAIPGERVIAGIERVERQLAFATTIRVVEPSPDRREPEGDPLCGGSVYAHVTYSRQLTIKSDIVQDAFTRLGRITLPERPLVAASPERGYRMRARLHVSAGRAGFYREGTHLLCDPAQTGQMINDGVRAIAAAVGSLASAGAEPVFVEVAENLSGDQRVLRIECATPPTAVATVAAGIPGIPGLSGCTITGPGAPIAAGATVVSDDIGELTRGRAGGGRLARHAESFFQANRFLLPELVGEVLDAVPGAGSVLDLYAGVGLFSAALAASGRRAITAVEGDRSSGADLTRNAEQFDDSIQVVKSSVESFLRSATRFDAVIADPPRTGMSRQAVEGIARAAARRIVYVSCDPPTMARDARRLVDAGYALRSLRAFDLFPNTPHVESLGIFERE